MWSRIRSLGPGGILTSLRALKDIIEKQSTHAPIHAINKIYEEKIKPDTK